MYIKTLKCCTHCGREMASSRIKIHEKKCLQQQADLLIPKRKAGRQKGTTAWNKGLTKHTDLRVLKNAISLSETQKRMVREKTFKPRQMGDEAREKLSKLQSENNRGGKCKWFVVGGIKVQGLWEYNVALKLTELKINWQRGKPVKYFIDDKIRHYTADFYLPDQNIYLEIKGYWWGDDKRKMQAVQDQHPDMNVVIIEKDKYEKFLGGELVW